MIEIPSLNNGELTLEGYVLDPGAFTFRLDLQALTVKDEINLLLQTVPLTPGLMRKRLQKLLDVLCAKSMPRSVSVQLVHTLKSKAYMIDGKDIYFSLGALLRGSSAVTFSVFCHEFAHMLLSVQDGYASLKVLNRQFKTQYAAHPSVNLLSPIEYCAMRIATEMMQQSCQVIQNKRIKKHFIVLIDEELHKIAYLENEIKKIK